MKKILHQGSLIHLIWSHFFVWLFFYSQRITKTHLLTPTSHFVTNLFRRIPEVKMKTRYFYRARDKPTTE